MSGWIGHSANTFCQPGLHRACPVSDWLESCSFLPWGKRVDGWWDVAEGGGGDYCRFRSYSCGATVIISPLLLNSVILSYISGARGQEILQCINRSTLCKGDYCMAYILTSLFSLKDFFSCGFTALPRFCLCSVVPYWLLSRGSVTATQSTHRVTCSMFAYQPASLFYCSHGEQDAWR